MRVIDAGIGRRKPVVGARTCRRITPDCVSAKRALPTGWASARARADAGRDRSSSVKSRVGDVVTNDWSSVSPCFQRTACEPSRQRGESDQSPPSSWRKPMIGARASPSGIEGARVLARASEEDAVREAIDAVVGRDAELARVDARTERCQPAADMARAWLRNFVEGDSCEVIGRAPSPSPYPTSAYLCTRRAVVRSSTQSVGRCRNQRGIWWWCGRDHPSAAPLVGEGSWDPDPGHPSDQRAPGCAKASEAAPPSRGGARSRGDRVRGRRRA